VETALDLHQQLVDEKKIGDDLHRKLELLQQANESLRSKLESLSGLEAKLEAAERESERLRGEGMRMLEIVECNDPGNAERFRAALTQEDKGDEL
jgi:hypothetical protein